MQRHISLYTISIVAIIALLSGSASASIIFSESFEHDPQITSFITVGTGGNVGAFDVLSGNVDWIGAYWQAADGTHSLDMNGTSPSTISYDLSTIIGMDYDVSFSLAGNPSPGDEKTLAVSAGTTYQSFLFDTASTTKLDMGWENHHFFFTATDSITSLKFSDIYSSSNSGAALDNIVVSTNATDPIPEPATMLLFGTGLAGLVGYRIRKSKKK